MNQSKGLFAEGPGTREIEHVALFRPGRKLKELDVDFHEGIAQTPYRLFDYIFLPLNF